MDMMDREKLRQQYIRIMKSIEIQDEENDRILTEFFNSSRATTCPACSRLILPGDEAEFAYDEIYCVECSETWKDFADELTEEFGFNLEPYELACEMIERAQKLKDFLESGGSLDQKTSRHLTTFHGIDDDESENSERECSPNIHLN